MSSLLPPRPDACKTPVRQSTKPRLPNAPPRIHRARSASDSNANRRLFGEPVHAPARGGSFSAPEIADEDFTTHRECVDPLYNANAQCSICLEAEWCTSMGMEKIACWNGARQVHCKSGFPESILARNLAPAVVVRSVVLLRAILMRSGKSEQMLRDLAISTDSRVPMYGLANSYSRRI